MGPAAGQAPAVFGRFEAADPNELWVGDALHGPRVGDRKTYLFAFLDDHIPAGCPATGSASPKTPCGWPRHCDPALAARGVPAGIYVDNGSAFVDAWLLRACAKLGVRLVHSAPGRPQGRGKIETILSHRARTVPGRGHRREPARTSPPPGSTTPPRCWSSTGCSRPGWKPNTTAGPFRDRADPAGPLGSRLGPVGPHPGHADGR